MHERRFVRFGALLVFGTLAIASAAGGRLAAGEKPAAGVTPAAQPRPARTLAFEENRGQADARVRYLARGGAYGVALTDTEAVLSIRRRAAASAAPGAPATDLSRIRMRLGEAARSPRIVAHDPQPGTIYYAGPQSKGPLTPIETFARVEYKDVYPGIDLVYYGNDRQLEFDFVVAPNADPDRIAMLLDGVDALAVTAAGDLSMHAGGTEVRLKKPVAYQQRGDRRVEIAASYRPLRDGDRRVRLQLGDYDRSLPLVIDPTWMTEQGSDGEDWVVGVESDAAGNPLVLGTTFDPATFPATLIDGGPVPPPHCFLSKFDGSNGLPIYTILFSNTSTCETFTLSPNGLAYFTGLVVPNGYVNNGGTTVTVVDDSSGTPEIRRFVVGNYDSRLRTGVQRIAVNAAEHVFLLGPCRLVEPGEPPLELSGYNETPDPAHGTVAAACTIPQSPNREAFQPLLTVVDGEGNFLYGSLLSPGEEFHTYGLAADNADRAFIVGATSTTLAPTADAWRATCPSAGTRGFDLCGYLMALDTTTTGTASLVYGSYLWNTANVATTAVRLGASGELYIASEGSVFDDFPANRPTSTANWPYSVYPELREGLQLARFGFDANGAPTQFDFAVVLDPARRMFGSQAVRDQLTNLRLFGSGAIALGSIAYSNAPASLGYVTTFFPSGDALGSDWVHNIAPISSGTFDIATDPTGHLVMAGQVTRIGGNDSQFFVERIEGVDPGAASNANPAVTIFFPPTRIYADSPSGATISLNASASDPNDDPLTFSWSGPFVGAPTVFNGETDSFIVARLAPGLQQEITVTVEDGRGGRASASFSVDVVGTPFVGTTARPIDSENGGLIFNYAPVTITVATLPPAGSQTFLKTRLDRNPPIPADLQAGSPPMYFDVSTDAPTLTAPIDLCIDTRGMSVPVDDAVRLYHYRGTAPTGVWTDITRNVTPGLEVCGQTDSLGTFAIFYPQVPSTAIRTIAGNGVLSLRTDEFVAGPATGTPLNYLNGVAYDRGRNWLYFTELSGFIVRLDMTANTIARVAGNGVSVLGSVDGPGGDPIDDIVEGGDPFATFVGWPRHLAVTPSGDVLFFDGQNCWLRRLDVSQNQLFTVAGNGTCGFSGDGSPAVLASMTVASMAVDSAGHVFVVDQSSFRIRRIDAVTGLITTVAGDGTVAPPVDGAPALSSISLPSALAFDAEGHLVVAAGLHIIRIAPGADGLIDGSADEIIRVITGCNTNCAVPFMGDGLPVSNPQVSIGLVNHVAVARDGAVLLGDRMRIRRIAPGADGIVTRAGDEIIRTVGGYEDPAPFDTANFNGDTFATESRLGLASFMVEDSQGRIVIVDGLNHRVRRFGLAPDGEPNQPPVLTLPPAIVAEAQTPAGAVVVFEATAVDGAGADVPVVCSPASGSTFPFSGAGDTVTQVSCTATAANGATATGSFTVTVRDTTAPAVTAPPAIVIAATEATGARSNVPQAPDTSQLLAFLAAGGVVDAADPSPTRLPLERVSCSDPSIGLGPVADTTIFTVGPNCVAFGFRDLAGNTGRAIGSIEVRPPIGGHVNTAGVAVVATDLSNAPQPVTATFVTLQQPGLVTASPLDPPVTPPPGYTFTPGRPAFDVRSTALAPPAVVVCVQRSGLTAGDKLFLLLNGVWTDRTASVDVAGGTICGLPTSVGVFAVGEGVPAIVTINERVIVTDTPGLRPSVMLTVPERVFVHDTPMVRGSALIGLQERVVVNDQLNVRGSARIGVDERVVVNDALVLRPAALIALTERVTVTDAPGLAATPLTLILAPPAATVTAGASHTVTAFLADGSDANARVALASSRLDLRVQFTNPGAPNSPLSVTTTSGNPLGGSDLIVNLATDASGALSSTATHVAMALTADPAASVLVVAAVWPGSTGAGVVQPRPLARLTPIVVAPSTGAPAVCATSVPGFCAVTFTHPVPATLTLSAFADLNANAVQDSGEPTASAQATWVNNVPPACAADVTGQIAIVRGGFVFNPTTGRFTQQLRVTNTSGAPVGGPISIVLDQLSGNAGLFNAVGVTACTTPAGSPFVDVAPAGLASGETVTIVLQFTNPTRAGITYRTRILAGAGSR